VALPRVSWKHRRVKLETTVVAYYKSEQFITKTTHFNSFNKVKSE